MDFPGLTAYSYVAGNPAKLVDPDGESPIDPIKFSIGLNMSISLGGIDGATYNFGINISTSYRNGPALVGMNLTGNIYSGGVGTSNLTSAIQYEMGIHPSFTLGFGNAEEHYVNTSNHYSSTGITNDYAGSFTYGTNYLLNAEGRNSSSGSAIVKVGAISAGITNDYLPNKSFSFGNTDHYWGSTVRLQAGSIGLTHIEVANIVYNGERRLINHPDGPTPNSFDGPISSMPYVSQSPLNRSLNNGTSYAKLRFANGFTFTLGSIGGMNLRAQDNVHIKHKNPQWPLFHTDRDQNKLYLSVGYDSNN